MMLTILLFFHICIEAKTYYWAEERKKKGLTLFYLTRRKTLSFYISYKIQHRKKKNKKHRKDVIRKKKKQEKVRTRDQVETVRNFIKSTSYKRHSDLS